MTSGKLLPTIALGFFIGIGLGRNGVISSNEWEGEDAVGCMLEAGYVGNYTNRIEYEAGWYHYSQCFLGEPFNEKPEDTLDAIYIKLRYHYN